jgi:hypothetical protein
MQALVDEITPLTDQLTYHVKQKENRLDLSAICLLSGQLSKLHQRLYASASIKKQSFATLPNVLLLMIATANTNPSLRAIGLTCKAWYNTTHKHAVCIEWTRAVHRMEPVPLLEWGWVENPRSLPGKVVEMVQRYACFTSLESKELDSRYIPTVNWTKHAEIEENDQLPLPVSRARCEYSHLTANHIFGLVVRDETDGLDGPEWSLLKFDRCAGNHVIAPRILDTPPEFFSRHITACAWSPDSLFVCMWHRNGTAAYILEYDLETCTKQDCRAVMPLFNFTADLLPSICMTWVSGFLVVGLMRQREEDDDTGEVTHLLTLSLVHCKTKVFTTIPERRCQEHALFASLQMYGRPLFYFSIDEVDRRTRLRAWNADFASTRKQSGSRPKRKLPVV